VARLPADAGLGDGLVKEIVTRFRLSAPIVDFLNRPFIGNVEKKKQYIFKLM
jgi:hypothetical protein